MEPKNRRAPEKNSYRVAGMPFRWSLNPYRGCRHACVYCFARPTHAFLQLDMGADFSGIIWVKTNVAAVLAGEVGRRGWRRDEVAIGTAKLKLHKEVWP